MWARPEGFSTFKADALKSDKFSFLAAIPFAGLCRRKLAGGSAYSQIAQSKRDTTEVVSLLLVCGVRKRWIFVFDRWIRTLVLVSKWQLDTL